MGGFVKIYNGTLRLQRTTKRMAIYGNDVLAAQYVPKAMLKAAKFPKEPKSLRFVIVAEEEAKGANTSRRGSRNV
jgi:hypothetical protein